MADDLSAVITVRLTPRAGRDQVDGWVAGVLQVRVRAAPADGAANEALCRCLAAALRVPPSSVSITSGHRARVKRLQIAHLSAEEVARRLET